MSNPFEFLPHSDDEEVVVKEQHKAKKAPRQDKADKKDKPVRREAENKNENIPSRTRDSAPLNREHK